jgi:hypothetical protein
MSSGGETSDSSVSDREGRFNDYRNAGMNNASIAIFEKKHAENKIKKKPARGTPMNVFAEPELKR